MKQFLPLLLSVTLLAASCEKPPATPASAAQINAGSLEGKRVQLSGTAGLPEQIQSMDGIMHFAIEDSSGIVICNINPGTGKDEMEQLHNNYKPEDLKITAHDGSVLRNGGRLTVKGEVGREHDSSFTITVDEVTK